MSDADEIQKLQSLRQSGALSESEFEAAKARLLSGGGTPPAVPLATGPSAPQYNLPSAASQPAAGNPEASTRQWAMFLHLSMLAAVVVPLAGLAAPIVIWQIKKTELPGIDVHGCHATNWIITQVILTVICIPLCFLLVGIPLLLALSVLGIIFPVIAGIKANNGEIWRYPMSFTFFRPQSGGASQMMASQDEW